MSISIKYVIKNHENKIKKIYIIRILKFIYTIHKKLLACFGRHCTVLVVSFRQNFFEILSYPRITAYSAIELSSKDQIF